MAVFKNSTQQSALSSQSLNRAALISAALRQSAANHRLDGNEVRA
jgi:hypothetical protein